MDLFDKINNHLTQTIHLERFDSRDLISASEEAKGLLADEDEMREWEDEDRKDLKEIVDRIEEIENEAGSEWTWGETYIREEDFVDYAKELAEDIGNFRDEVSWPYSHIDWDAAAKALQEDYSTITIDGVDYLVRAS